ncbi:MAG: Hpt domain-containing protein [Deltaproteobacteria bacterium]|nr:Hpt domain-containing protein [Deltaproteobacteria bacterium]
MDQNSLDQRIKANAYRVFFAELEKHLAEISGVVAPGKTPGGEVLRRVGGTFHTIRGGAGFFGLEELAAVAGRIEDLLLQDTQLAKAEIDNVRRLVEEISSITRKLPKPT